MDPNITLKRLRETAADVIRQAKNGLDNPDTCFELAELIQALDEYLSNDGYLPKDWVYQFRDQS